VRAGRRYQLVEGEVREASGTPVLRARAVRLRRAAVELPADLARAELERRVGRLRDAIAPDGMLWVAWPKRASGVPTDVTEDIVREVALPTGLVDVKVCAIDATWSGLKLVVRRELR
ncbi:MAG TPA: hypothetical protein VLA98_12070, partial [Solirubrobacteraceae bacterium]|nr:hypothetical protein [Solirubrobacteraceae bacterium]